MEKICTDPIYIKLTKVVDSITDISQYNSCMRYLKLSRKALYKKYPQEANKFLKFVDDSLEFNIERLYAEHYGQVSIHPNCGKREIKP